jgi:hypothetical protein
MGGFLREAQCALLEEGQGETDTVQAQLNQHALTLCEFHHTAQSPHTEGETELLGVLPLSSLGVNSWRI